jgi:hypothetical protein
VQIELRDDGSGVRRAVIIACGACEDIRIGDEISSIMLMGKNYEYDGLDLIELLSEEFEVKLRAPCFVVRDDLTPHLRHSQPMIASRARCMGAAALKCEICGRCVCWNPASLLAPQVVLSLVRAGLPVGHVCLVRDGSIEDSTAAASHLDSDRRVGRVGFSM